MPKLRDLTGQKFGKLTVLERAETKNKRTYWKCRCDCGNIVITEAYGIKTGHTKSCGCLAKEAPYENLVGKKFNRLTVVERVRYGKKSLFWRCRCDCGKETVVSSEKLKSSHTQSCGCKSLENTIKRNLQRMRDLQGERFGKLTVLEKAETKNQQSHWLCECDCGNKCVVAATNLIEGRTKSCGCQRTDVCKSRIIKCDYTIDSQNVVHVILRTGEEMLCDLEDWEKLKNHGWRLGDTGYAQCGIDNKTTKFHIKIMGRRKGLVIDHINRNRLDNRRCNLRFVTQEVNTLNRSVQSNNKCGVKGVSKHKGTGLWEAIITVKGKQYHLGLHKTIQEAEKARKEAEEKYHKPIIEQGSEQ